jgi:hypothetical protein
VSALILSPRPFEKVAFRAPHLTLVSIFLPASGESSWSSPIEDDPEPPDLNVPNSASAAVVTAGVTVVTNALLGVKQRALRRLEALPTIERLG